MRFFISLVILFILTSQTWANEDALALTVKIEGGDPDMGQVIATLFDSEDTYMKYPAAGLSAPINNAGEAFIVFENLIAGYYAVSIIYDKNANDELDTGFLGIPKEKIGFSNNARGKMGPAPFEKAKFNLTSTQTEITIILGGAKKTD